MAFPRLPVTTLEFRDKLARRTRRAKAPVTLAMLEPLEAYFRLLAQWNAKINLTALPLDPPTDEPVERLLVGPLGAGKTELAKGVAEGLGVTSVVNSPTFVLMNEHVGRLRLFHIDAYRLDDTEEAGAAGLFDERQG